MYNMISGIYQIENITTGMKYIGSSTNLKRRKIKHFSELRTNAHVNRHLQRSFKKHGESKFQFSVLEYCDASDVLDVEQRYFDEYIEAGLWDDLYNLKRKVGGGSEGAFTIAQIKDMRLRYKEGESSQDIGDDYETDYRFIWAICNGKRYADYPGLVKGKDYEAQDGQIDEAAALYIRESFKKGTHTKKTLAAKYNTCLTYIGMIIRGDRLKDAPGPILNRDYMKKPPCNKGMNNPAQKLTATEVIEIRNLYHCGGFSLKEIAAEFEVSFSNIHRIVTGKNWKQTPGPIKGVDYVSN